jgi:hypothetical protein
LVRCLISGIAPGASASFQIESVFGASSPGTITNTATLTTGAGGSASKTTVVTSSLTDGSQFELPFRSFLDVEPYDGSRHGQIVFNQSARVEVANDSQRLVTLPAIQGKNRIDGQFALNGRSGVWRFDFSASSQFVPGSLLVESGQVYAASGSSIAFLVGPEKPPLRFTFNLR